VGIVWQGNPNHRLDRYRSIALREFGVLARIPGVRLVSLQRGPGAVQIRQVANEFSVLEPPHGDRMTAEDLLDTAALMKCLDLVIAVDTGAAHLAGALGVPVWVPMSAIGEWRWLLHREDSPWYPTMRLFRQKKLGHWGPVFRRMAVELERLSSRVGVQDSVNNARSRLASDHHSGRSVRDDLNQATSPSMIALPVQAAHAELSVIASAVDDTGPPSRRLLDVAMRAVSQARQISLASVKGRTHGAPNYLEVWPGEHYKLLAGIVAACRPKLVLEIGTATGLSALAMRSAMPEGGRIVTFDLVPWHRFADTCFLERDFADGSLEQILGDLSEDSVFQQHAELFQSADFIFVDGPKDGKFERELLQLLAGIGLPRAPLVMLDDIRVWNMLATWREIGLPKLDLTSFGHWSGTGLIDWLR
jgi:predicted O-methyltransferase YrrM